jgi:hypothetical protein
MVVTQRDVENFIDTLAKPVLETARATGIGEAVLDIRADAAKLAPKPDDYQARLLKYIPAEVVAVYLTLDGIVRSAANQLPQKPWLWIIFVILLIGTPIYLWRITKVTKKVQLIISTLSFAVWIFALGGAFATTPWYKPVYGTLLLPIYTFIVPFFEGD